MHHLDGNNCLGWGCTLGGLFFENGFEDFDGSWSCDLSAIGRRIFLRTGVDFFQNWLLKRMWILLFCGDTVPFICSPGCAGHGNGRRGIFDPGRPKCLSLLGIVAITGASAPVHNRH
uniref:Uncharacterized protein n=1 Tax=Cacopsylla melanoneura TaxID=428564 RepID=A0A8D8LDA0_9HEMI